MLHIHNISKYYKVKNNLLHVIRNVDIKVEDHEFAVVIGPSGCGKTTLLKIIAGLIRPSKGKIFINNKHVSVPGRDRGIVFQQFSLFPWLTVKENIAFGLDLQRIAQIEKEKIVNHYLNITLLNEFSDFYPGNLSGGMQQRVAIARTLANNPNTLLMDEPFGSLDSQTRSIMQNFLTSLWESERKTILFVTHDVPEAIFLADKIYVVSKSPMEIIDSIVVPFSRPRHHEIKRSKRFFEFQNSIFRLLEEKTK